MSGPAAPPVDADQDEPLSMRWSIGRTLAVIAALSMVLFWAWIFSGGPKRDNPDRLQDRAYATTLETRCQVMLDELDELPEPVTVTTPSGRARSIATATRSLESMVDDIEADAPTSGDAGASMQGWIRDWRTYLQDRRDYVTELRQDPTARFLVSVSPLGDSVDKTIEVFSQVNEIPACETPGDIG